MLSIVRLLHTLSVQSVPMAQADVEERQTDRQAERLVGIYPPR